MDMTYAFETLAGSGETYAVHRSAGEITGICGPLHYSEVKTAELPDYEYDYPETEEDVEWARGQSWGTYTKDQG